MTKSNAKKQVVKNESIHKNNKAKKKTFNLDSINQSKSFIDYAKQAIKKDIEQTKNLTFESICSVVCLSVSLYKNYTADIINKKDSSINQNKLRTLILDSLFTVKDKKDLQDSQGRVIYNKIKAGLIIFNKDLHKLCKLWESLNKEETQESQAVFIAEVLKIVESYKSLTKILAIAKKEKKQTESESESTKTTESEVMEESEDMEDSTESTKSDYTRVNEALSLVIKLLDREEKRDSNFLNMVKNHLERIVEGLQKNGYYSSQKLKEGVKKIA